MKKYCLSLVVACSIVISGCDNKYNPHYNEEIRSIISLENHTEHLNIYVESPCFSFPNEDFVLKHWITNNDIDYCIKRDWPPISYRQVPALVAIGIKGWSPEEFMKSIIEKYPDAKISVYDCLGKDGFGNPLIGELLIEWSLKDIRLMPYTCYEYLSDRYPKKLYYFIWED